MKKNARVTRTIAAKDAMFLYISICCTAAAEKPACVIAKGQITGTYVGAKPEGEGSLGRWRCTACRKPCKVTRNNKPKPESTPEVTVNV